MRQLILIPFTFLLFLWQDPALAQRQLSFDANTALILSEMQAVIVENEGALTVRVRMGQHGETEGDQLEEGDVILMINGERVKDIASLRRVYEGIPETEEIKVGVRRDDQRFIVRAVKGDVPEPTGGGRMVMSFEQNGDGPPPVLLPELGLLISDSDGQVIVNRVMEPITPAEITALNIRDYAITEIDGEKPENAEQAKELLNRVATGEALSLSFSKDEDVKSLTIKKPESRNTVMTRNND